MVRITQCFILFILIIVIMDSTDEHLYDNKSDDFIDGDTSVMNESSSINIKNSTNTFSSSSLLFKILSTSSTPIENKSTSFSSSTIAVKSFIDQINSYRDSDILTRIKQCDPNMKLNDICETYSIDNNTHKLIRQSDIEFHTLQHLSDALVERTIVQKLNESCLSAQWCLGNLSENNIHFTNSIIRERGQSFCSLDQCHFRLLVFINSCPTLSNTNVSIPSLKLLPMLCTLYNEQQSWNSTGCTEGIVYFLHILYAFWPQLETCHDDMSASFNVCTPECQRFGNILNKLEDECDGNVSFLSQVSNLAWYQSINLKQICHQKNNSTRFPFVDAIQKFFSSNAFWYQFHEKLIYVVSCLVVVICTVISLSLCCYLKLKRKIRRFDDNYEYTRLHNSSFELGLNTEITDTSSITNETMDDEPQLGSNGRVSLSEYQRLLHVQS